MRADRRVGAEGKAAFLCPRAVERETGGILQVVLITGVSRSTLEGISGSGEVEGVKHIDRRSVNRVTSTSDGEDEEVEGVEDSTEVWLGTLSSRVWKHPSTCKGRGDAEDLCDDGSSV